MLTAVRSFAPRATHGSFIDARISGEIFTRQRFGGVSRYCVELARELNQTGTVNARIAAGLHINEYLWNSRKSVNHRGLFLSRPSRTAKRICDLAQKLNRKLPTGGQADVIHLSYYGHEHFRGRNAAKICTFYDMIHERFAPDPTFFERKQKCLKQSDRSIAISEATKADMVHFLGADPDKIDVVYLASRITFQTDTAAVPGQYLLWVGARNWYKNFEAFVRGYVRSRAASDGVSLLCAGGPPITPQEQETWHGLGLDPGKVRYLQPTDHELAALYASALGLVYASLYEGFGIPPLEAMMCNCPVIASDSGSIPEVVGDAALMIDPQSPESIATQIDELIYNRDTASRLRRRGSAQAAKFSWARCAQETLACYRRALEISDSPRAPTPVDG